MNQYESHGFRDRDTYFRHLAEKYDVPLHIVISVAWALGREAEFDRLPLEVEEFSKKGALEITANRDGTKINMGIKRKERNLS